MQNLDLIKLPDGAEKFIKAQRDKYQRSKVASTKMHIQQWIVSCYKEAKWLSDHMDFNGKLLDIGCGLGGIDVLLAPQFNHMYLLDGTGWDDKAAGYQETTEAWNSLDATRAVMGLNDLDGKSTVLDFKKDLPSIEVDVVISVTSWCYHYPVDTYLEWVSKSLAKGGYLCVDIRFHDNFFKEGQKIMDAGFVPTCSNALIKWGGRWKGVRQVYVKG